VGPPTQGGGPGGEARPHDPPGEPAPDARGEPAGELRAVVVQDAASGRVLMLAWMDDQALRLTRATGEAHFWSRSRRRLWRKGETSGHTLSVEELREDCDGDAILLRVRAAGPVVASRAAERPRGSYVAQLLDAGIVSCARKVGEEALEAALAATSEGDERLVAEVADLWFHTYVLLASRGLDPAAVEEELERRHRTT
jgi:phosphoribosyl-ATP pyrophosphohydrolase/phosphoribosyl-AMP cyclohydrolase